MRQNGMNRLLLAVKRTGIQGCPEHFLRTGSVLDDRTLRSQIALEDCNRTVRADCLVKRMNNILPGQTDRRTIFITLSLCIYMSICTIFFCFLHNMQHDYLFKTADVV